MRGDLDWIVMKALDKDRGRRFQTANSLADVIQRYLKSETVIFFFKQKTAYEMATDWSSDVCSSDLIVVENIFRHLGAHGRGDLKERILVAAEEIGSPMFFSTLVILVAFIPLFTMTGVSGVIFSPLART